MSNAMSFVYAPSYVVQTKQTATENLNEQALNEARERLQAAKQEVEAALKVLQPKPKFATLYDFAMSLDDKLVETLDNMDNNPKYDDVVF